MSVFLGFAIALVVVLFDQLSKYYMLNEVLGEQAVIEVTPFFNWVRAWNTGVSFSMFNDYGSAGAIMLSVVAGVIVIALIVWLKNERDRLAQAALGMVIGGAIGNVIDRVRLGAVFDFLDFHIADSHWPAFNLADSFICAGAVILIIQSIFIKKEEKQK
ncbi:MAG: signal peptidase II [Proteobacteria bacterium]|nr:signal peptidase II [Pseudomonadota bacterium]